MNAPQTRWRAHKFGGSSLADYECFQRVAALVNAQAELAPSCVVVSAMGGMTDVLLQLIDRDRKTHV